VKVAVIGGGVTGLCAAYQLHKAGVEYRLFEQQTRFGGKIKSSPVGERIVDAGADSFLARSKATVELCEELGLGDELVTPAAKEPPYIFRDGELHKYPKGTYLGFPLDISELKKSNVVSEDAVNLLEENLNSGIIDKYKGSVGDLCRSVVGDEITNYLIDPLIGGINASSVNNLCLKSATPTFYEATQSSMFIEALHNIKNRNASDSPVFYGLRNGTYSLIEQLVDVLSKNWIETGSKFDNADTKQFDGYIYCTPASKTSEMLQSIDPELSKELSTIEYASVAQVTLEFDQTDLGQLPDSPGIIFPQVEKKKISACTLFSSKWDHYKSPGKALIRLTTGKYGNDIHTKQTDDKELTELLLSEIQDVIEVKAEPLHTRVQRWPNALPQYLVGHASRRARLKEAIKLVEIPTRLAGASYDGIGIPACVESGQNAANEIIELLQ